MSCGYPGHVVIDEDLCGDGEHDNYASWSLCDANDAVCVDPTCNECREIRKDFGWPELVTPQATLNKEK